MLLQTLIIAAVLASDGAAADPEPAHADPMVALCLAADETLLRSRLEAELASLGMQARTLDIDSEESPERLSAQAAATGAVAVVRTLAGGQGARFIEIWALPSVGQAAAPIVVRPEDTGVEDLALHAAEVLRARLLKLGIIQEASPAPSPRSTWEVQGGAGFVRVGGDPSLAWQGVVDGAWVGRHVALRLRLALPISPARQTLAEGDVELRPYEIALEARWRWSAAWWGIGAGADVAVADFEMKGLAVSGWAGRSQHAWTVVPGLGLEGALRLAGPLVVVIDGRLGWAVAEPVARVAGRDRAALGRPLLRAGLGLRWGQP